MNEAKQKKKLNASKTAFVISVLPLLLLSHISGYIKFQRQQQNPKKIPKPGGAGNVRTGKCTFEVVMIMIMLMLLGE